MSVMHRVHTAAHAPSRHVVGAAAVALAAQAAGWVLLTWVPGLVDGQGDAYGEAWLHGLLVVAWLACLLALLPPALRRITGHACGPAATALVAGCAVLPPVLAVAAGAPMAGHLAGLVATALALALVAVRS